MFKLAALAFPPIAAVTFGVLVIALSVIPGLASAFTTAALLYYGAAALSVVIAIPLAYLAARRMLTRRERRLLDARAAN